MPSLQKITYVFWHDADGRRVPKSTAGAKRHVEESTKWYACWREGKKQMRVPLCTDKTAGDPQPMHPRDETLRRRRSKGRARIA